MTKDVDKTRQMSLARFEALVEAYGSRSAAWPEAEREAAEALVSRSAEAQQRLAEAARLDELLDRAPRARAPSAALRQRVIDAAPRPRRSWLGRLDSWTAELWPFGPRWQPAAALVAAGLFGLATGAMLPASESASAPADLADLAFGTEDEWRDTP